MNWNDPLNAREAEDMFCQKQWLTLIPVSSKCVPPSTIKISCEWSWIIYVWWLLQKKILMDSNEKLLNHLVYSKLGSILYWDEQWYSNHEDKHPVSWYHQFEMQLKWAQFTRFVLNYLQCYLWIYNYQYYYKMFNFSLLLKIFHIFFI